jgi:hypothetical protein
MALALKAGVACTLANSQLCRAECKVAYHQIGAICYLNAPTNPHLVVHAAHFHAKLDDTVSSSETLLTQQTLQRGQQEGK